ncbi:hypothetical protein JW964_22670 [candidate division KSB1 bacterium]|nr:hypothetical protein [candidate division KSB1 bacterium]
MQSELGVIVLTFICLAATVITVKLLVNGRIWKKLIENNLLRENLQLPDLSTLEFNTLSWLRWGIVIILFSLSLIVINILPNALSDEIKIGISGIFIGAAFIISYIISKRQVKK